MHAATRRPSPATAISLVALFISLGSVAWAIEANSVKSKHIADNQVKSADVRDDTLSGGGLGSADVAADALTGADIQESTLDLSNTIGNAVVFFQGACPAGWTEFTEAQGRYLVGLPSGGALSATVGTALTNSENRAVGGHDHPIEDLGHSHSYAANWGWNDTADQFPPAPRRPLFDFKPADSVPRPDVASHSSAVTGIQVLSTGIPGTNAPYIQLRACHLGT